MTKTENMNPERYFKINIPTNYQCITNDPTIISFVIDVTLYELKIKLRL